MPVNADNSEWVGANVIPIPARSAIPCSLLLAFSASRARCIAVSIAFLYDGVEYTALFALLSLSSIFWWRAEKAASDDSSLVAPEIAPSSSSRSDGNAALSRTLGVEI